MMGDLKLLPLKQYSFVERFLCGDTCQGKFLGRLLSFILLSGGQIL